MNEVIAFLIVCPTIFIVIIIIGVITKVIDKISDKIGQYIKKAKRKQRKIYSFIEENNLKLEKIEMINPNFYNKIRRITSKISKNSY